MGFTFVSYIDFNEDVSNLSSFSVNVGLETEIHTFYHVNDVPSAYNQKFLSRTGIEFYLTLVSI